MKQDNGNMNLYEHLMALRHHLIMMLCFFILMLIALLPFINEIFQAFIRPIRALLPPDQKLLAIGVVSPVIIPLKVVLFTAFCGSLPYFLYQVWKFIAPALYKKEKRYLISFVLFALIMFAFGISYCYFVVFNFVFAFILEFAPSTISVAPDIDAYISFVLNMFLAFGLAFLSPVIVVMLYLFKLVSLSRLTKIRRYIIVLAFLIAAIFTPPDVSSQLLLALPLIVLYEAALVVCKVNEFFNKRVKSKKNLLANC